MMLKIRDFCEADLAGVSSAFMEAWNDIDIGERWTEETSLAYMKYWKKRGAIFLVAEHDGEIAGAFVSEIKPWWSGKQLYDGELFVRPSDQGKGVGKALMIEMMKRAKKLGAREIVAFTYHGSIAHKWYKKLGMPDIEKWVLIEGRINEILENLESKR